MNRETWRPKPWNPKAARPDDALMVTVLPEDPNKWPLSARLVHAVRVIAEIRLYNGSMEYPDFEMPEWSGYAGVAPADYKELEDVEWSWPRWARHAAELAKEWVDFILFERVQKPIRYEDIPEVAERPVYRWSDELATEGLNFWISEGITKASALTSKLAYDFGLTYHAADKHRKRLGFVPAYKGGPVVAPKGVAACQH